MPDLPNPFEFAGSCPADTAAVSPVSSQVDAAAEPLPGGPQEAATAANMGSAAVGLLVDGPDIPLAELVSRGFDGEAFLNDIEPLPAFLGAPSAEYMTATEIIPVLEVLAGH